MKIIKRIYIVAFALLTITVGCESILSVDSDKILVFDKTDKLDLPNDTLYSMVGIFTKLQNVAERHVVLGELRADLMTISEDATVPLVEISKHNISLDNPYNNIRDYYEIINNCNYLISMADTAETYRARKIYKSEYAAALAIKAWTYMQIFQYYGEVSYYDTPIMSTNEINLSGDNIITTSAELVEKLAPKLEAVKDIEYLNYGYFDRVSAEKLLLPVRCVLGDLYLLNGDYKLAADNYYEYITENLLYVAEELRDTWEVVNGDYTKKSEDENDIGTFGIGSGFGDAEEGFYNWAYWWANPNSEMINISYIGSNNDSENGSRLTQLYITNNYLLPSEIAKNNWANETYYHDSLTETNVGDWRGLVNSYLTVPNSFDVNDVVTLITKFSYETSSGSVFNIRGSSLVDAAITEMVSIYRMTQIYLRFAEAVNRAGKPNLAFATLKCGLNPTNLRDTLVIPKFEDVSEYPFNESPDFEKSIGIHELGSGNVSDINEYKIPELSSLEDSILFVEDAIMHENTLELAFEGNRFFDLMRVAKRRGNPDYLAQKVAAKYDADSVSIRNLLQDEKNWYLKFE